ncbi:MAG: Trm112 family protein [Planctomycetia bacterium]|nr:Trm112 family protein [Planctomycetia bacterium]NCG12850.1 Trm112 family protein [Planctomycetia bacterium]
MHPDLLKTLTCICPERAALEMCSEGLLCKACGRIHPIIEGIPHILSDTESDS